MTDWLMAMLYIQLSTLVSSDKMVEMLIQT